MKKNRVNQATALLTIATVLILAGCACDEMCGDHKNKPATRHLSLKSPKHVTPAHQAPMQKACPAKPKPVKKAKHAPAKVVKKTAPKKHVAPKKAVVKKSTSKKVVKKDTKYVANTQADNNPFGIEKELADLIS